MNSKSSPFEVLHVNSKKVSCDGGNSSSKHPLVYLNMGNNDSVICPYCSKTFILQKNNKIQLNKKQND